MDLVLSSSKTLAKMVKKIMKELYSQYTRQREKQITKKQDSSSQTTSSQNPSPEESQSITTAISSVDTTEKTTTKKVREIEFGNTKTDVYNPMDTEEIVCGIREWAIDRIIKLELANGKESSPESIALYKEYGEWIHFKGEEEVEIVSLDKVDD